MTRRRRTLRYGASLGLALAGVACGAIIPGTLGGTLATALIGIGLVGVLSLVFYEIGLSEDRDRAAEKPSDRPVREVPAPERPAPPRAPWSTRLDRRRGEHRRLP